MYSLCNCNINYNVWHTIYLHSLYTVHNTCTACVIAILITMCGIQLMPAVLQVLAAHCSSCFMASTTVSDFAGRGRRVRPLTCPDMTNTFPLRSWMWCMTSDDTTVGHRSWLPSKDNSGTITCVAGNKHYHTDLKKTTNRRAWGQTANYSDTVWCAIWCACKHLTHSLYVTHCWQHLDCEVCIDTSVLHI